MITISKLNSHSKLFISDRNVCSIYLNAVDNTAHVVYINGKTETVTNVESITSQNL